MIRYRKVSLEVEAVEFTGENFKDIENILSNTNPRVVLIHIPYLGYYYIGSCLSRVADLIPVQVGHVIVKYSNFDIKVMKRDRFLSEFELVK